jgi:type II secretory pathway pseudopilin PulG
MLELLTVIAIVGILTTMVLGNYNAFGGQIILRTLAYDMALSLREAQTYGVSVRRSEVSAFSSGYGIHYDTTQKNTYTLYTDAYVQSNSVSSVAGPGGGDGLFRDPREEVRVFRFQNGYGIKQICVTTTSETCYPAGIGAELHTLDILFKRPEPDAQIRLDDTPAPIRNARIELVSPRGNTRSVLIEITGQISVQ